MYKILAFLLLFPFTASACEVLERFIAAHEQCNYEGLVADKLIVENIEYPAQVVVSQWALTCEEVAQLSNPKCFENVGILDLKWKDVYMKLIIQWNKDKKITNVSHKTPPGQVGYKYATLKDMY